MESYSQAPRHIEPCAPVHGGIRWHRLYHEIEEYAQRHPGSFVVDDPDTAKAGRDGAPERAVLAPEMTTTPPEEARMGEEYTYRARAFCSHVDGFVWSFEKAAPGMAVDRHSGLVTWTPTEGGYVDVVLRARSLYGAEERQSWTILVRRAIPVRRRTINARFQKALVRKGDRATRRIHSAWRRPGGARRALRGARAAPLAARRVPAAFHPAAPPGAPPAVAIPLRI